MPLLLNAVEWGGQFDGIERCGSLLSALRELSLAVEKKLITAAPRIKLREERKRTAVWDSAAEALFLSKAKGILRDVFIIIQDTGMRPDEVLRMRQKDILWGRLSFMSQRERRSVRLGMFR